MKRMTKIVLMILIMFFAVPAFAETGVVIDKVLGSTLSEEVTLNSTDKVDVEFNDLDQKVTYKIKLKNNTDDVLYVNDLVTENISEEFIEFSLAEKSYNAKLEPGKNKDIEVVAKTLDITHAGRNVNDEITLKFLLGDKIKNPATSSNWIVYLILVVTLFVIFSTMFSKIDKKKKLTILVVGLLCGTMIVSASDSDYVELKGKVKYTSQNLMQESGIKLNDYKLNSANSFDVWMYTDQVKNIIISDDMTKVEEYNHKFDLTANDSKRIYGYLVENGDKNVPYDFYILANGVIYAPMNATGLFSFPNVETIKGLEYIEFDNTTDMTAMFMDDSKLTNLDTKVIDTSNVINTPYMFNGCDKLSVSEKNFDLSNVINKEFMFDEKLVNVIKSNSKSDKDVDFGAAAVTGKYIIDNTKNDENPIYYYRGAVTNNNVIFAEKCWKMVRTTDTGGIKAIYNGFPSSDGKCNNSGYNSHINFGNYTYGNNTVNVRDLDYLKSNVKTVVETWYKKHLINYTDKLENTVWCNDKQVDSATSSMTIFKPKTRFYDVTAPSLVCSSMDSLKVKNDGSGLTYPIGLLTADELGLAGIYRRNDFTNNYLDSNSSWWTMSAVQIDKSYSYMYRTSDDGHRLNFGGVNTLSLGIRPAISLKSETEFVYGTGTANDPYIVE